MPSIEAQGNVWVEPARVEASDIINRTIDIKLLHSDLGAQRAIPVMDFGNYSFPKAGDFVLALISGIDNPVYCIGKIDYGYKEKVDGKAIDQQTKSTVIAKAVKEGEIFIGNLVKRMWLHMAPNGDFSLMNGLSEGINYIKNIRFLQLSGIAVQALGSGSVFNVGAVARDIPSTGKTIIPSDAPLIPAIEGMIDLVVGVLRLARFHIGHIKNALGVDELGSWGARLRAIIEVCAPGVPLAVLKMDEIGNIELSSTMGVTMLNGMPGRGILLGGLGAAHPVAYGDTLLQWIRTHTHGTGVGPSSVPNEVATLTDAVHTSKQVMTS